MTARHLVFALAAIALAPALPVAVAGSAATADAQWGDRVDRDSDRDSDRRNGRDGGIFGRARDGDSDSDSDSDSDGRGHGRRGNGCIDINGDGFCDFGTGRHRRRDDVRRGDIAQRGLSLPEMIGAIMIERGRRNGQWARWLPTDVRRVRYADTDRNGVPERAVFYDSRGRPVQMWVDSNRNGRANLVHILRDGRVIRTFRN